METNHNRKGMRQQEPNKKGGKKRKTNGITTAGALPVEMEGYEKRKVLNTNYAIPKIIVKDEMGIFNTFMLVFTRGIVLEELDEAIYIQNRENMRRRWRRERRM